jgi:DNA-binding NarL/FixJ family response regulator
MLRQGIIIALCYINLMSENNKASKNLLIIDSSVFIIERLVDMLKNVKSIEKIFTATDYNTALEVLNTENAGVVLLDIQLPDKNGIDLLKYIVHNFSQTKVIVLSNLVSDYYQNLCKKEGAYYFIDKSKDFDKIPEVILSIP